MKKTIVVADRDESLQHAFMTVFSRDHFEIIYASNGKEVEKVAERIRPDVYIVNVDLPKMNGIEVYKKLQKQRYLETASFFFLKDEKDATELLGYQAAGVIEKPLNFFRVYETVTREDDVIELTDLIEEKPDLLRTAFMGETGVDAAPSAPAWEEPSPPPVVAEPENVPATEEQPEDALSREEERTVEKTIDVKDLFEDRLRNAIDGLAGTGPVARAEVGSDLSAPGESQTELEAQFKTVLNQAMEEAALKLSARLAPILTQYVEDYVKRMLLEIAEKVIRDEIDKLLKESTG